MSVFNGNPDLTTTTSHAQEREPKEVEAFAHWMLFTAAQKCWVVGAF